MGSVSASRLLVSYPQIVMTMIPCLYPTKYPKVSEIVAQASTHLPIAAYFTGAFEMAEEQIMLAVRDDNPEDLVAALRRLGLMQRPEYLPSRHITCGQVRDLFTRMEMPYRRFRLVEAPGHEQTQAFAIEARSAEEETWQPLLASFKVWDPEARLRMVFDRNSVARIIGSRPVRVDAIAGHEEERLRVLDVVEERGEFVTGGDGFVRFWPEASPFGHMEAHHLRWIADELDRRNSGWEKSVGEDLATLAGEREEPS